MGRICITGLGVITAIGNSLSENRKSLLEGRCGITKSVKLSSKYSGKLPFGEVKLNNEELKEKLQVKDEGITRTTLLTLHAFKEAVESAGLTSALLSSNDTALIGATTVGGLCLMDDFFKDANSENPSSPYFDSYDCASVNLFLQKHYSIGGIINTINTACSSSANAIMYGARLIQNGLAKRVIAGGGDCLSKFTVNGFNALNILSSEKCRPFDIDRSGLNLGEGAAFLVLEREEDVSGKKVYGVLSGYSNTNDAFHPSALSEDGIGPYLAMNGALESAKLKPANISFINVHGTATENNDEVESRAMIRLFGKVPEFASTKSNTGHTLGGSGAVEAVYSMLNIIYDEVYPAVNFEKPIPSTGLVPMQEYKKMPVIHVMSNSFGFGGNCSSLIFSKA